MPTEKQIIYLDNAATTKPFNEVLESYNKANELYFANPSSVHFLGAESLNLLNKAKQQILEFLKLRNHEVIFTSGATEAINLGIKGYCLKNQNRGKHIITSIYEHPAVSESIKQLVDLFGFEVTYLDINKNGIVDLEQLKKSLRDDTILVAIMAANNEIGSINNLKDISFCLSSYPKICFFSDTTQAIGKLNVEYYYCDMFVIAGHKIHGLKGTGCLVKKKNINLVAINNGGGQQNDYRSGTIDVPGCISLARAIRLNYLKQKQNFDYVCTLRDRLLKYIGENNDKFELNSYYENPYIVNFSSKKHKASVIVEALSNEGIYVSTISACHSKKEKISNVVLALKHNDRLASNTIRVSFSYDNTIEEVDTFINIIKKVIEGIKQ